MTCANNGTIIAMVTRANKWLSHYILFLQPLLTLMLLSIGITQVLQ